MAVMNAATQAMNKATEDMRDYALYSTVLLGVGTVLLIGTLLLTLQANNAAVAGSAAAQEQVSCE